MTSTEDLYGWLASHGGEWTGTVVVLAEHLELPCSTTRKAMQRLRDGGVMDQVSVGNRGVVMTLTGAELPAAPLRLVPSRESGRSTQQEDRHGEAERDFAAATVALHGRPWGGEWWLHGACLGQDPDDFVPKRGEDTSGPLAVCRGCTVRTDCLHEAIVKGEHGVWGGTTGKQRKKLRGRFPQRVSELRATARERAPLTDREVTA